MSNLNLKRLTILRVKISLEIAERRKAVRKIDKEIYLKIKKDLEAK